MASTDEPSMLVQPSLTGYSQETSHIFISVFRDLFTQDGINEETVRNLAASKTGDHGYHDRYVEKLQNVQVQWQEKLRKTEKIIKHLKQATEKARSVEQEELKEETEKFDGYEKLGLPPVPSKLHLFLDNELLQSNNLILPSSFNSYAATSPTAFMTENVSTLQFMNSTFSSRLHFDKSIVEDNYLPEPEPKLPSNSTLFQKRKKTKSSTRSPKTSAQSTDKNIWRQCINPYQREAEKKGVANLQKRADFLKNPRFLDNPRSFLVQSAKTNRLNNNVEFFQPYPCPVVFNDYEVNCSYQIKLILRNVTSSCRQVRVVQPCSPYFSVSHGEFPTDSGLVAPGMCCYYTIHFAPVSLADYEDVLEVKTQSDESLFIPLQAHRDAPILTLPSMLDCGYSLVGDTKILQYVVKNNGGPGRFCFKVQDESDSVIDWDNVNFNNLTAIECDPFVLSPSCFELNFKQNITIQVQFKPNAIKAFARRLILFCDNFVKKEYIIEGTGEVASIQMQFVEGGLCQPKFGETTDQSAGDIIRFSDLNPGVPSYKEVHIKNTISVPLKYTWNICAPSMSAATVETCLRKSSVFSIEPDSGYLTENTITKFMFCFQALNVGHFYDVASLILDDIPTQNEHLEYENCKQTSLKVSLKAVSVPFQVVVKPPILIFCGDYYINQSYCRRVTLNNKSDTPTHYHWETVNDETCFIDILPNTGEIGAQSEKEFIVTIRGKKPGKLQHNVVYTVPYHQQYQGLYIEATFVGPNVNFLETTLEFGLVRYGTSQDRNITLYNDSPTDASWSVKELNFHDFQNAADFIFHPSEGNLPAFHKQSISVCFKPHSCMTLNSFIENSIQNGNTSYLPIHAEVQRPNIVLEESALAINEAFLHIPTTYKVVLVNAALLESKFNWTKICDQDKRFSISFEPEQGILQAQEKLEIDVTLTCHQLGSIEFLATCNVEEAIHSVVLSVVAQVVGLSVDFYIPNMKDLENEAETIRNSDVMDFGDNVILGEPTCCLLMVENQSGINTTFTVTATNFPPARLPTPPAERSKTKGKRPLLSKTANIADYDSKTDEQAKKEYTMNVLRDGRGVAFVCSPSSSDLKAFEKKIITVTAYSNMWGDYHDALVLKLDNLDEKHIPVHIDVIGSPLNFQMAKEQPPLIRFGAHLYGSNDVHRSMKINNTSHVDIQLDWETYVIDPNDDQLLDLTVYIGNPFPVYNEHGEEINGVDDDNCKLIQVRLSEHNGQCSHIPFNIEKPRVLIPALSSNNIDVTFHPATDVQRDTNYLGYGLAYMSLHKKDKACEGLFYRSDGLDMLPFALNMNGSIKAAKIFIEACDEEGFSFDVCATDLMSKMENEVVSCRRRFILVNVSDASISFRCSLEAPFKITHVDTGKTQLASSKKMISLKPQKNVEIVIEFQLNRTYVSGHDSYETLKPLIIHFSNGTEQRFDLIGKVVFPKILLSHDVLNFDTCYVGEKKELSMTLANDSEAMLFWKIKKDPKSPPTSQSVFELVPSEGQLKGRKPDEPNHRVELIISFSPKHNVAYGCQLHLYSILQSGNQSPIGVVLHGKGSYDEAYQENI